MELLKVIQSRRSIRKFKSNEVPDAVIRELLDAARLAPSGSNLQATRFVVIKSPAERMKLKECTPLPFVAHAPVIIACCIDREAMGNTLLRYRELMEAQAFVGTPLDDPALMEAAAKRRSSMDQATIKAYLTLNAAIAIEHIVLRAVDLGLGSCWVQIRNRRHDAGSSAEEYLRGLLRLPEQVNVAAIIGIGHPGETRAFVPAEDLRYERVRRNRYA